VIRASLANRIVPCVYALMEHKTKEAYRELFTSVDTRCTQLDCMPDPVTVVSDFEVAAMQAIREVFRDGVETHRCFFHLTQATWHKIQELGLVTTYKDDAGFRLFCSMLDGLAFLLTEKAKEGMTYAQ